ncbi:sulfotransferase family protein [Croceicoccus sp. Ery15]|uniref:sulfotransferase family protein n=1 Tax=Croceicoccus sp. Ery15 TaxID=1703338 RepID=UPI001E5A40AD|nr:sulfotransferase family protein [Croceicoccus sp. Ery15]
MKKTKVFCIGFQKTGTSSMRDALQQLGYRVVGVFGRDTPLDDLRAGFVETGLAIARDYDAVEDMPWPLMFRELDAAFPGSRFILTLRETDKWYKSIAGHFGDNPYHIQQLTYGDDAPAPVGHEARYREVYDAHNKDVIEYFRDRPGDLLVMELERGDGWQKLGQFLGEAVPEGSFVQTNSSRQRKTLVQRVLRRLRRMGLPIREMGG